MLFDTQNPTLVRVTRAARKLQDTLNQKCHTYVPQVMVFLAQSAISISIGDCALWDSEADDIQDLTPTKLWEAWHWHVNALCEPFVQRPTNGAIAPIAPGA